MAYFPFFIDIKDKSCIIFGGGLVAFRKITALLEFDADITVIAPFVCEEIEELRDRIKIRFGEYEEKEIEDAFFVIAATNNSNVNSKISKACREKKIMINVVDELSECDFLFPAYVKKGNISIGVTTSGNSPVMAGKIRKTIKENLPDYYDTLVDTLGGYRDYIKKVVLSDKKRSDIFKELAQIGIKNQGLVTSGDVEDVISKYIES